MSRRLLLVVDAAAVGGVTRIVVNLAEGLRRLDWQVRTVFPSWAGAEFVSWCRNQGFEPELSPALTSWSDTGIKRVLSSQLRLRSFIRDAQADVVNFHYSGSIISAKDVVAARLAGVRRCVASVHLAARWEREKPLRRTMTGIAATLCDRVVAESSNAARGQLAAGVPRAKLVVIPNGARTPAPQLTNSEARARLGLSPDDFVVGAAARLAPVKRLQDLVEAVGVARNQGIPVRAVIAGDGPERAALQSLARERANGAIEFLGQRPDPTDIYFASDVLVLPSELEGQPNMPMEAALCGRPCIGTAIGGTSDIIVDGVTGFLVPVGAPDAIAQKIVQLYANPELARGLGSAALKRAQAEFSAEQMVSRYDAVLRGAPA